MPTYLAQKTGDGKDWHFEKSIDDYARVACRGECWCEVFIAHKTQCREPAAIITANGDAFCAKHFGWKATQRIRELSGG